MNHMRGFFERFSQIFLDYSDKIFIAALASSSISNSDTISNIFSTCVAWSHMIGQGAFVIISRLDLIFNNPICKHALLINTLLILGYGIQELYKKFKGNIETWERIEFTDNQNIHSILDDARDIRTELFAALTERVRLVDEVAKAESLSQQLKQALMEEKQKNNLLSKQMVDGVENLTSNSNLEKMVVMKVSDRLDSSGDYGGNLMYSSQTSVDSNSTNATTTVITVPSYQIKNEELEAMESQLDSLRAELAVRGNYVIKLEADRLSLLYLADTLRNELDSFKTEFESIQSNTQTEGGSLEDELKVLRQRLLDEMTRSADAVQLRDQLLVSSQQTNSDLLVAKSKIQLLEKDIIKQTSEIAAVLVDKASLTASLERTHEDMMNLNLESQHKISQQENIIKSLETQCKDVKEELLHTQHRLQFVQEQKSNNNELLIELETAKDRIRSLESERLNLSTLITELQSSLINTAAEKISLTALLEAIEGEKRLLANEFEKLHSEFREHESATQNLSDIERELDSLRKQLVNETSISSGLRMEINQMLNTIQILQSDILTTKTLADNLEKENQSLQNDYEDVKLFNHLINEEKSLLQTRLTKALDELKMAEQVIEEQRTHHEEVIHKLESESRILRDQEDFYRQRLDALHSQVSGEESIKSELDSYQRRLNDVELDRSQLILAMESLQNKHNIVLQENENLNITMAAIRDGKNVSAIETELVRQELAEYKATTTLKHSSLIDELHTAKRQYIEESRRTSSLSEHRDQLVVSAEKIGTELFVAKERIKDLEKTVSDLTNDSSSLRVQLTALQTYKTSLTQSLDNLREESAKDKLQMTNSMTEKDLIISGLEKKLKDLEKAMESSTHQLDSILAQQSSDQNLLSELHSTRQRIENLEKERSELESNLKTIQQNLSNEIQTLQTNLKVAEDQHNEDNRRISSLESEKQSLLVSIKELTSQIVILSSSFSTASANLRHSDELSTTLREESAKDKLQMTNSMTEKDLIISGLEKKLKDLEKAMESSTHQLDSILAQQSSDQNLLNELHSTRQRIENLEKERSELESNLKTIQQNLSNEIQTLQINLKVAEDQHNEDNRRISSLESEKQSLLVSIKELTSQLVDLTSAFSSTSSNLRNSEEQNSLLYQKVLDLQTKNEAAMTENSKQKDEMDHLQKEMDHLKLLEDDLRSNLSLSAERNISLQTLYDTNIKQLEDVKSSLLAEITRRDDLIESMKEELASTMNNLTMMEKENTKIQKNYDMLQSSSSATVIQSQKDYEQAIDTISSLQNDLISANNKCKELEEKIVQLNASIVLSQSKIDSVITSSNDDLQTMKTEKSNLEKQLKAANTQVAVLRQESLSHCTQIIQLEDEKKNNLNIIMSLDKELASTKAKIVDLESTILKTQTEVNSKSNTMVMLEKYQNDIASLSKERDNLQQLLSQFQTETKSLSDQLFSLQNKLAETNAQLEEKSHKVVALKYDQAATKKIIQSLQKELDGIKSSLQGATAIVTTSASTATNTTSTLPMIKTELSNTSQSPSISIPSPARLTATLHYEVSPGYRGNRQDQLQELLSVKDKMHKQLIALQNSPSLHLPESNSTNTSTESNLGEFASKKFPISETEFQQTDDMIEESPKYSLATATVPAPPSTLARVPNIHNPATGNIFSTTILPDHQVRPIQQNENRVGGNIVTRNSGVTPKGTKSQKLLETEELSEEDDLARREAHAKVMEKTNAARAAKKRPSAMLVSTVLPDLDVKQQGPMYHPPASLSKDKSSVAKTSVGAVAKASSKFTASSNPQSSSRR